MPHILCAVRAASNLSDATLIPINRCSWKKSMGYSHENIRLYLPVLRIGLRSRGIGFTGWTSGPSGMHGLRTVPRKLVGFQAEGLSTGVVAGTQISVDRCATASHAKRA